MGGSGLGVVAAIECQSLTRRDLVEERCALELNTDAGADFRSILFPVEAEDFHFAGIRVRQALDHLQHGGLARAVGPQQAEHFSSHHVQVHTGHGEHVWILFFQSADAEGQITHECLVESMMPARWASDDQAVQIPQDGCVRRNAPAALFRFSAVS